MELLCKWCNEVKPNDEFARRNAKLPYSQSNVRCCKECNTAKNRKRYKNPEIKGKQLKANAEWRNANPKKIAQYADEFYRKNKVQMQAKSRIGHLVRRHGLKRMACEICGVTERVEAHHQSYAEKHWEKVHWLCKEHHEYWHTILDPIKAEIADKSFYEATRIKNKAKEMLEQIRKLRKEYRALIDEADVIEDKAWDNVFETSEALFYDTFKLK
jgi:hypothetical protein